MIRSELKRCRHPKPHAIICATVPLTLSLLFLFSITVHVCRSVFGWLCVSIALSLPSNLTRILPCSHPLTPFGGSYKNMGHSCSSTQCKKDYDCVIDKLKGNPRTDC